VSSQTTQPGDTWRKVFKYINKARHWWLMPVILAAWVAEIRRIRRICYFAEGTFGVEEFFGGVFQVF
jgi:hypothetical protein